MLSGDPESEDLSDTATQRSARPGQGRVRVGRVSGSAPVFVDPTGRRSRVMRLTGCVIVATTVSFLCAVAVVLTASPSIPYVQEGPRPLADTVHDRAGPAQGGDASLPHHGKEQRARERPLSVVTEQNR